MKRYDLIMPMAGTSPVSWRDAPAILADVAPHLASEWTFAMHRSWREGGVIDSQFIVSNIETGLLVASGESKYDAIRNAKFALMNVSMQAFRKLVRKTCRLYPELDIPGRRRAK